jgi:hypothetical protein
MATTTRIDYPSLRATLGIRTFMELGLREAALMDDSTVRFKMGAGRSCAYLTVTLNAADLFDFTIVKVRGLKVTELGSRSNLYYDRLADVIIDDWCAICSAKGW